MSDSLCFQTHSRPFTPSYMRSHPLLLHTRENTRMSDLSTNSPVTPTSAATEATAQHCWIIFDIVFFLLPPPQQGQTHLYMNFLLFVLKCCMSAGECRVFVLSPAAVACCVCAFVFSSGQKFADRLSHACWSQR